MPPDVAGIQDPLEQVLKQQGVLGRPVVAVHRRRSDYESSFRLEEVTLHLASGDVVAAMHKDVSPDALSGPARLARSGMLHNPLRELRVYRRLLSPAGIGPRLLATIERPLAGRYALLLEKVNGVELYQAGDRAEWRRVARWLARFHGRFAPSIESSRHAVPVVRYERALFETWLRQAKASSDDGVRRLTARVESVFPRLLEELDGMPRTLVHGDFYPSNILIAAEAGDRHVVPVDWEMAGIGPGLLDLAALTSGWSDRGRAAMAAAYCREWRLAYPGTSASQLCRALSCCRLLLALRWLGAPAEWKPPEAHALDWLAEAEQAAEHLDHAYKNGGPARCEHW